MIKHINPECDLTLTLVSNSLGFDRAAFTILAAAAVTLLVSCCVQSCRNRLEQTSVTDEEVSECLCSVLLLEDFTTEQVFTEFLSTRLVSDWYSSQQDVKQDYRDKRLSRPPTKFTEKNVKFYGGFLKRAKVRRKFTEDFQKLTKNSQTYSNVMCTSDSLELCDYVLISFSFM